ncbi:MAG TPA: TadE/TadG family type IV pilus assembly protein [Novosphingobium sp.]|nr:TadE/TadG family type IV pilus assembly protein [Novosphingobium sp.]
MMSGPGFLRWLGGLRRDRRGALTVEFAFWTALVFMVLLPVLDFALYVIEQQRLSTAVTSAAMVAYNDRSASALPTSQLTTYVSATSGFDSTAVTSALTCNGGLQSCSVAASARTCACVSGTPATYTASASCGATCSSGSLSGFYLTVSATHTHKSIVPNPWLNGKTISSATTVRLQ